MKKVLLSWSSGKDSAWTLHHLRRNADIQVAALVTSFNSEANRVAMHAVRRALVEAQAERAGLPLWAVDLPSPCSNAEYEDRMRVVCQRAVAEGIQAVAFGDLFLQDIRDYRIRQLQGTGLEPLFPLWLIPTADLALEMIVAGLKAKITCVDPAKLANLLPAAISTGVSWRTLPPGIDPCGENGEFHTFVHDAPPFSAPSKSAREKWSSATALCSRTCCRCDRTEFLQSKSCLDQVGPAHEVSTCSRFRKLTESVRRERIRWRTAHHRTIP